MPIRRKCLLDLEVVGGQKQLVDQGEKGETKITYDDLTLRYERWLSSLQQVLDRLPDASLDLLVEAPTPYRDIFQGKMVTLRACLLQAIGQCAVYAGHIQFICQLFADGERVLGEVTEQSRESITIEDQTSDCALCASQSFMKEQEDF